MSCRCVPGGNVAASLGPYFCVAWPTFWPRMLYSEKGYCIDSAPPTTMNGRSSSWRSPAVMISAPTAMASAPLPQMLATVSAGTS